MARKINSLKTSQEACEPAAAGNRQPMPPTAALYLAQLRPHPLQVPPPGARQQIAIQIEEEPQAPRVVKIIHTDSF
jgi:hypothetical protein